MGINENIAILRKKKGVTQEALSFSLGLAHPSSVGRRINRKYGTIMATVDILDALDYEMVIRAARDEPLAENEYLLHSRDYEEDES